MFLPILEMKRISFDDEEQSSIAESEHGFKTETFRSNSLSRRRGIWLCLDMSGDKLLRFLFLDRGSSVLKGGALTGSWLSP